MFSKQKGLQKVFMTNLSISGQMYSLTCSHFQETKMEQRISLLLYIGFSPKEHLWPSGDLVKILAWQRVCNIYRQLRLCGTVCWLVEQFTSTRACKQGHKQQKSTFQKWRPKNDLSLLTLFCFALCNVQTVMCTVQKYAFISAETDICFCSKTDENIQIFSVQT